MKRIKYVLIITFIAFSFSCKKPEPIIIKVEGMTCEGCEKAVQLSVKELKGIINVEASYAAKNVIVAFDTVKVSLPEIKNKIREAGYTVIERN